MFRIRLFVDAALCEGALVAPSAEQAHYLRRVMRCRAGDAVALFNGRDGEWRARLEDAGGKNVALRVETQSRGQANAPDLWLVFAPIKHGRLEFLVEKAVELGVSALLPVRTQYSVVTRVNPARLRAHCVEAAEQSGRLDLPELREMAPLASLLGAWPRERTLIYGDESGGGTPATRLLADLPPGGKAVLIGPEGGFSAEEHALLRRLPFARAMTMGPRVMRADTAALAALACVQAWAGDWEAKPRFHGAEKADKLPGL